MRSTQFMRALSWFVLLALVATMAPPALSSTDGLKQQDGVIAAWSGAVLAENRLTSVSGAATATFVYDGDGNRVKTAFGSTTTVYVGNTYERDYGTTVRKYYYAGGVRIAMRSGGQTYYLLGDHLGGTNVTANGTNGAELGRVLYRPWGETRVSSGSTPTTWRFTGQREDATIGLYYFNARYLDPQLGRFTQPDTIVPEPSGPQALNRYSYVLNNPVRYRDPSGHWVETVWDIANIAWDIYEVRRDPSLLNWGALVVDVGAAALPFVPAGVGLMARGGKAAMEVAGHAGEVAEVARLGTRSADFQRIASIPGANTLLKKLLSGSTTTLKGAEFELDFALNHADEIEEMGRVLEVIQGGSKEIDFVLKGNVFVNVKNYDWAAYGEFTMREATGKLVREAQSFLKYNPAAVKYVFKGSVPDSVRQALEAAGVIVEVMP